MITTTRVVMGHTTIQMVVPEYAIELENVVRKIAESPCAPTPSVAKLWKEWCQHALRHERAAVEDEKAAPPIVFLDDRSRPFLAFRGWLHYRAAGDRWVTLRELKPGERTELQGRKLSDDQAALYGWPCAKSHADGGQNNEGDLICPDGIPDSGDLEEKSNDQ